MLLLLADGGEGGAGLGGLTVRRLERGRRLRGEASVDGGVRDGQAGISVGVSQGTAQIPKHASASTHVA